MMVEIRKIIEKEKDDNIIKIRESLYPLMKFYCDWIVHSEKDEITAEIEQIMLRIDKEYLGREEVDRKSANINLIYMEELRKEKDYFLGDFGLSKEIIEEERWVPFVQLISKVLVDQPINFSNYNNKNNKKGIKPIHNIESFTFELANNSAAIWSNKFLDDRKEQRFANAF